MRYAHNSPSNLEWWYLKQIGTNDFRLTSKRLEIFSMTNWNTNIPSSVRLFNPLLVKLSGPYLMKYNVTRSRFEALERQMFFSWIYSVLYGNDPRAWSKTLPCCIPHKTLCQFSGIFLRKVNSNWEHLLLIWHSEKK